MTMQVAMGRASATETKRPNTAVPGDAKGRQLAWQREMERAQLSNWFKPDLASRDETVAPQAASRARGADFQRSGSHESPRPMHVKRPLFANTSASMPSSVIPEPAGEGAPRDPTSGWQRAAKGLPPSKALGIPSMHKMPLAVPRMAERSAVKALPDTEPNRIEAAQSRPFLPTASGEPPPVLRLHAEPRPEGQAIWIAIRANDDALRAMLPSIVADLQRALRERGERLHFVVCNGRPVWQGGIALLHGDDALNPFHTREI